MKTGARPKFFLKYTEVLSELNNSLNFAKLGLSTFKILFWISYSHVTGW